MWWLTTNIFCRILYKVSSFFDNGIRAESGISVRDMGLDSKELIQKVRHEGMLKSLMWTWLGRSCQNSHVFIHFHAVCVGTKNKGRLLNNCRDEVVVLCKIRCREWLSDFASRSLIIWNRNIFNTVPERNIWILFFLPQVQQ